MGRRTLLFRATTVLAGIAFLLQPFITLSASTSAAPYGAIAGKGAASRWHPAGADPVLSLVMTAIERGLAGVPAEQKAPIDNLFDQVVARHPDVSREELRRLLSTWKKLPGDAKAGIDWQTLVALTLEPEKGKQQAMLAQLQQPGQHQAPAVQSQRQVRTRQDRMAQRALEIQNEKPGPPVIWSVTPRQLTVGQQQFVTILGKNLSPDMTLDFGPGVQVIQKRMTGKYQLTARINVAATASLQARPVMASNKLGAAPQTHHVSAAKPLLAPALVIPAWSHRYMPPAATFQTFDGGSGDLGQLGKEFPRHYVAVANMTNNNQLKDWSFLVSTKMKGVALVRWQVSTLPMNQDVKDWEKPSGLVAFGSAVAPFSNNAVLTFSNGGNSEFEVDFTPIVSRRPGASPYSTSPPAIHIGHQNQTATATQPSPGPGTHGAMAAGPPGIKVRAPASNGTTKLQAQPPPQSGQAKPGSRVRVPVPGTNHATLKPKISPSTVLTQFGKRNYYVRVVLLGADNKVLGLPSQSVQITYDPTPVPPPNVQIIASQKKYCQSPSVRIKSYEPIRDSWGWESQYWFIVASDPFAGSTFSIESAFGWHVGDHIYLPPKTDEDKGFWDYLGDFFEGLVSFVEDLVNVISAAWDGIKGAVVNAFADFLKGTGIGCPGWCADALMYGLNTGLMALGVPPEIPNFNELEDIGSGYLVESIAGEVLANSPIPISADDVKSAAKSAVSAMQSQWTQAASGGSWLIHDYTKDARPGYLVVRAFNDRTDVATDPGAVGVNEELRVYLTPNSVTVPPLQPGDHVDIPIFLQPDLDLPDGIPTSFTPVEHWGDRYFKIGGRFNASAGCGCPGVTTSSWLPGGTICYPAGGSGDEKDIPTSKPYADPSLQ